MSEALVEPDELDPDALLAGIRRWVEIETPSDRPETIARLLEAAEEELADLPVERRRIAGRDGRGDHLVLSYNPEGSTDRHVLVLGHVDTVWPSGTLAERPFRIEGDKVFGPGIYDMKAGTYLGFSAIRDMARKGIVPPRPVAMLLNSDEEVGSPTSRALIEELAGEAAFVLVPEPAVGPRSAVVTARKGWARFEISARGRPAHAGGNHAEGRSAIREIARHILDLEAMTDYERGTTFNVGVVSGGTLLNVVPAEARMEVDMRVTSSREAEPMTSAILAYRAYDEDVALSVRGGMNRPPFERAAAADLYAAASQLARRLGFDLPETTRGGVSDGNFTAAMGRPTLDGLGCGGHGAHAEDEHILISTIAERAALMLGMLSSPTFQNEALGGRS